MQVAIVGAGIVGLANAYAYARRGHRVTVYERNPQAIGASTRNFGMVWPIGQPSGEMEQLAMQSRALWVEVLDAARLPYFPDGSLHLAYHDDEEQVAREFAAAHPQRATWIGPELVHKRSTAVVPEGLRGGLFSTHEVVVDPMLTIASLPTFLTEQFGVEFHFNTPVNDLKQIEADYKIVCGGDDFQTLYPEIFTQLGVTRCKLQMMRTVPQPDNWRLGPSLAGGLTMRHYESFLDCPSLPRMKARMDAELPPELARWGIHVMVSQTAGGGLTIGDSHEYDLTVDIFDKPQIDEAILNYLATFARLPEMTIAQRWHGVYAKHKQMPYFTTEPEPGVRIILVTTGAGMTLSFGLADQLFSAQ